MELIFEWQLPVICCVFIFLDIITGICCAIKEKTLNSTKMREGMWHKFAYILCIMLAIVVEYAGMFMQLGFDIPLVTAACVFITLTEITSIMENIISINPDLSESKISEYFKKN